MRLLRQVRDRVRNSIALSRLKAGRHLRVQLGCGDDRLPGFVNIDTRFTSATDVVADLNEPACLSPGSVSMCYSNAFFEHLYRANRLPHLRRVHEMLEPEGACCYIGLPYFRNVAKLYLEGGPGIVSARFDLYNVYRYTHGDPESVQGWWLEQLHKSLFDEEELAALLAAAGFKSYVLFSYCYPGEERWPVNIGFYAAKGERALAELEAACVAFLAENSTGKVSMPTVTFLPKGAG